MLPIRKLSEIICREEVEMDFEKDKFEHVMSIRDE